MTDTALPARATLAAAPPRSTFLRGVLYGLAAVVIWGGYLAMARAGVSAGLTAFDFALIRGGVSGLVLLPWLLLNRPGTMAGVGWGRAVILTVLVGPLFVWLAVAGYSYSPLAHGAVIQPSSAVIGTTLAGILILRERPGASRLLGLGLIVAGIATISGPGLFHGSALTPLGDGMFMAAGFLWAAFTILIGRWKLGGLPVTAAFSVLSAAVTIPLYAVFIGFDHLATIPLSVLLPQAVVQGVFSAVLATLLFTRSVQDLGAGRAALFPALVPGAAILLGIPIAGEVPTALQLLGLGLVSFGLLVALGLIGKGRERSPSAVARVSPARVTGRDGDV